MKKILFCLLGVAAMTMSASAQEKAAFGIRAGVNFSNLSGDRESLDTKIGYNAGVSYLQPLCKLPLFVETGLYFTNVGAKASDKSIFDGKATLNVSYVQLPVVIGWRFDINNFSIQPYVGGYYAYGVSGKMKVDGVDKKVNLFKESSIAGEEIPAMFRRSDVGLRFGVGFALNKRYVLTAGYDLGLMNIAKTKEMRSEGKIRNGNLFVSLGYNF